MPRLGPNSSLGKPKACQCGKRCGSRSANPSNHTNYSALSRRNQGFDSPTGYQRESASINGALLYWEDVWESNPKGPAPLRKQSGTVFRCRVRALCSGEGRRCEHIGRKRADANSPTGYQGAWHIHSEYARHFFYKKCRSTLRAGTGPPRMPPRSSILK